MKIKSNYFKLGLSIIAFMVMSVNCIFAQGVGAFTNNPDSSAVLDIVSAKKGLLIPRVALEDINSKNPIAAGVNGPAQGLLVFNTNASVIGGYGVGYYYWLGSQWNKLTSGKEEPWYSISTDEGATKNIDSVYILGHAMVGTKTLGQVASSGTRAKFTVAGGDAFINGVIVGRGGGNNIKNAVVGSGALYKNTIGSQIVAIGNGALAENTTGSNSVAVGYWAMNSYKSFAANIAIGSFALLNDTTGDGNIAIGGSAMREGNPTNSIAIGNGVLSPGAGNSTSNNIAIGSKILVTNGAGFNQPLTGGDNIGIGSVVLYNNRNGAHNVGVGNSILSYQNSGDYNVALGDSVYVNRTGGSRNIGLGQNVGDSLLFGESNILIGDGVTVPGSGESRIVSNHLNIGNAIFGTGVNLGAGGVGAGRIGIATNAPGAKLEISNAAEPTVAALKIKVPFGGANTDSILTWDHTDNSVRMRNVNAVFNDNAWKITGNANIVATATNITNFLGTTDIQPLVFKINNVLSGFIDYNTTSDDICNVSLGYHSLPQKFISNNTGQVAIGSYALSSMNSGPSNTAIGSSSLKLLTTGSGNTAIGNRSLYNLTTGTGNTALGSPAASNQTAGDKNIAIGTLVDLTNLTGSNQLNIGNAIFGTDVNKGVGDGNVGIGDIIPSVAAKLNISNKHNSTTPVLKLSVPFIGAVTDSILTWNKADSTVRMVPAKTMSSAYAWQITGNDTTNSGVNFLGTTDNVSLRLRTNNLERMVVDSNGNVGVGINKPLVKLQVDGSIISGSGTDGVNNITSDSANLTRFYWDYGRASLSAGRNNTMSGVDASVAFGQGNYLTNGLEWAIGYYNKLSGYGCSAVGLENEVKNYRSTAFGTNNTVGLDQSIALGANNEISATNPSGITNAAAIGSANKVFNTASAAVGYQNRVSGWKAFSFGSENNSIGSQSFTLGVENTTDTSAAGSLSMGIRNYTNKYGSIALGVNNTAKNSYAIALGVNNIADSSYGIALGSSNKVNGDYGIALGSNNTILKGSDGAQGIAIGNENIVSNLLGISMGTLDTAAGYLSTAIGAHHFVSGYTAFAAGEANKVRGKSSAAFGGRNKSAAIFSMALGFNDSISANAEYGVAIGKDNSVFAPQAIALGANAQVDHDNSVVIGDGTGGIYTRSTAVQEFTAMFNNGFKFLTNTGSGTEGLIIAPNGYITAIGTVTNPSDLRLKKDIQPLSNVLSSLKEVRGVTYYWKDATKDKKQQVGVIAQELEKVYPQLVTTSPETGMKSVNYAQFTGVLLEGIKEQQTQIEQQQKQINTLTDELQKLKAIVEKLAK